MNPSPKSSRAFILEYVNHHCLQVKVNVTHENGFAQFGGLG